METDDRQTQPPPDEAQRDAGSLLQITPRIAIPTDEIELRAIRAQGAGGQNVNKVSSAIHLRFDIRKSSLPEPVKERLLHTGDQRITRDGILVIKAQTSRSQEANREDALQRLRELLQAAAHVPRSRKATKPTAASKRRRLEAKTRRGEVKAGRGRVTE